MLKRKMKLKIVIHCFNNQHLLTNESDLSEISAKWITDCRLLI